MPSKTSYTQLSTLADCEQRFAFKYVEELPDPGSRKTALGSLMHGVTAAFWEGTVQDGHNVIAACDDADQADHAHWLYERYVARYGSMKKHVEVVATEEKVKRELASGIVLRGYIDQLWRYQGELWLRECKTMGDWGRVDTLTVDPQLSLYYWLVQEQYPDLFGIKFDAIKTYRWKTPGRPIADSFQMISIDRTQEQVDKALEIAVASVQRAEQIRAGATPIPNIGRSCSWCPYRLECFDRLAFPALEIELVP